jgi:hypothetical protein
MLNRNERGHALAALLRRDYSHFTTVIEKSGNLPQRDKVSLLAAVLRYHSGTETESPDVSEILSLINGSSGSD